MAVRTGDGEGEPSKGAYTQWLELGTSHAELRKMKFTGNATKIIEDLMRVRVAGGKVREEDEMYLITSGKLAIEQAILKLAEDPSLSEHALDAVYKHYRQVYPKKK